MKNSNLSKPMSNEVIEHWETKHATRVLTENRFSNLQNYEHSLVSVLIERDILPIQCNLRDANYKNYTYSQYLRDGTLSVREKY